jgi:DivIVA domain-containing protein
VFTAGYNRSEVDLFLDRIMLFLNGHASLTAIEVRDTVFTVQNRGYVEDQVDAFLDAVVSFILASR